jgi:hypothetical protein
VRGRRLGQHQEVLAVCRLGSSRRLIPRLGQALGRELADRLEQPVAEGAARRLGHRQALVHQGAEEIRGVECLVVTAAAHPFHGVQAEAADSERSRAAASSMARGSPSSRRQTDTMSGTVSSSRARSTPCARARSASSAIASQDSGAGSAGLGSDNDGTR